VISVPVRSVVKKDDGTAFVRILKSDNEQFEERPVETGMEGQGGLLEVSNVKQGETVIVLIKS
jgi:multidrug efflux pump subunit AcrA (membrane-fusion protein)